MFWLKDTFVLSTYTCSKERASHAVNSRRVSSVYQRVVNYARSAGKDTPELKGCPKLGGAVRIAGRSHYYGRRDSRQFKLLFYFINWSNTTMLTVESYK